MYPLINAPCNVCGNNEASYSCNAIVCLNCRTFFIRNCMRNDTPACRKKGRCNIFPSPRANCSSCRLNRCYRIGMLIPEINRKTGFILKTPKKIMTDVVPQISELEMQLSIKEFRLAMIPPGLKVIERLQLTQTAIEFANNLVEFDHFVLNLEGASPSTAEEVNKNVSLADVVMRPELCASRDTASWDVVPCFDSTQKYNMCKSFCRQITFFADFLNGIEEAHKLSSVDKFQFNYIDVLCLSMTYSRWKNPYLYSETNDRMNRFDMPEEQKQQWKNLFRSSEVFTIGQIIPIFNELKPTEHEIVLLKIIACLNLCPELSSNGRLVCHGAKLKYQSILAELIRDTYPQMTIVQVAYRLKELLRIIPNLKKVSETSQVGFRFFITENFADLRG